jgi:sugar phosphate isomerase/epimerase
MEIAVAAWSLNRRFRAAEKPLRQVEFPALVRERFGVRAVELYSGFFAGREPAHLAEVREAIARAGSRAVHISVDGHGDLAALDEGARREAVERHKPWFEIARAVGSPSFRANTGGKAGVNEDTIAACIRSFKDLAAEGERKDVSVLIENHGGISGDPELIVRIMKEVDSPSIGTCPDFGNTPDDTRYAFLERIMPYAKIVHAKFREFDASGEDTKVDAKRCLDICRSAGFDGFCSIEFEGKSDDLEGVKKSVALLRKYL